jgi:hypothetical protein
MKPFLLFSTLVALSTAASSATSSEQKPQTAMSLSDLLGWDGVPDLQQSPIMESNDTSLDSDDTESDSTQYCDCGDSDSEIEDFTHISEPPGDEDPLPLEVLKDAFEFGRVAHVSVNLMGPSHTAESIVMVINAAWAEMVITKTFNAIPSSSSPSFQPSMTHVSSLPSSTTIRDGTTTYWSPLPSSASAKSSTKIASKPTSTRRAAAQASSVSTLSPRPSLWQVPPRQMRPGINNQPLKKFRGAGRDGHSVTYPNKHGSAGCEAMRKSCKVAPKDGPPMGCQDKLAQNIFELFEKDPNMLITPTERFACLDANSNYCARVEWEPWVQEKAGKFHMNPFHWGISTRPVGELMTQRNATKDGKVPLASVVESMNWILEASPKLCGQTLLTVHEVKKPAHQSKADEVGRYILKVDVGP